MPAQIQVREEARELVGASKSPNCLKQSVVHQPGNMLEAEKGVQIVNLLLNDFVQLGSCMM